MGIHIAAARAILAVLLLMASPDQTVAPNLDRTAIAAEIDRTVTLTEADLVVIKKVATTEVVASLKGKAFQDQVHGVVDTMINRQASGHWGKTMAAVADAPWQFSAINSTIKGAYGSVEKMPARAINQRVAEEVDRWLRTRSAGTQSSVGDNLSYLNPEYSSRNSLRRWGWDVVRQANETGQIFGAGNAKHYHGTAADLERYRPRAVKIWLPALTR